MSRISSLYLADIVEGCERVRRYLDGITYEAFLLDHMRIDAVSRNLEIIGEAVKNLPDEVKSARPDIEWKKIARFRDIIAHYYFKIDHDRVWSITQTKLMSLEAAARQMLETTSRKEGLD